MIDLCGIVDSKIYFYLSMIMCIHYLTEFQCNEHRYNLVFLVEDTSRLLLSDQLWSYVQSFLVEVVSQLDTFQIGVVFASNNGLRHMPFDRYSVKKVGSWLYDCKARTSPVSIVVSIVVYHRFLEM